MNEKIDAQVDEFDAPEPHEAADVKRETTLILWSSGTTGH